jgi:hypothetical protein
MQRRGFLWIATPLLRLAMTRWGRKVAVVIARTKSEAIQPAAVIARADARSNSEKKRNGLPRRYAARNDGAGICRENQSFQNSGINKLESTLPPDAQLLLSQSQQGDLVE